MGRCLTPANRTPLHGMLQSLIGKYVILRRLVGKPSLGFVHPFLLCGSVKPVDKIKHHVMKSAGRTWMDVLSSLGFHRSIRHPRRSVTPLRAL